jgi:hypothetical protein
VCDLIKKHDNRRIRKKSLELKILQDADLVADSGLVDIMRLSGFSGTFKRSMISQIKRMNNYGIKRFKLSNINLKVSKQMMKEKNDFLIMLKKRANSLLKSELL